jgi:hypothetical protein
MKRQQKNEQSTISLFSSLITMFMFPLKNFILNFITVGIVEKGERERIKAVYYFNITF